MWPSAWRGAVVSTSRTLRRLSFSDWVQDQLEDEAVALPTAEGDSSPCRSSLLWKWVGDGHPRLTWGCPFSGDRQVKHLGARWCYLASRAEIPLQAQPLLTCLFCLHSDRAGGRLLLFQQNSFLPLPQIMALRSTTKDESLSHSHLSGNLWDHAFCTPLPHSIPHIRIQFYLLSNLPGLAFRVFSHFQSKPRVFLPKFLLQLLSLCWGEAMSELSLLYYPHYAVMVTHYSHTCHSWSQSRLCSAGIRVRWLLSQPAAHSSSWTVPLPITLRMPQRSGLIDIQKLHSLSLILWIKIFFFCLWCMQGIKAAAKEVASAQLPSLCISYCA